MSTFFEQMVSEKINIKPDLESVEILPHVRKMIVESSVYILQSSRRLDFVNEIKIRQMEQRELNF